MEKGYLSVREAAPILGVKEDTLRSMLRDGVIPGYKMGKKLWRLKEDELKAYMADARNIPLEA